MSSVEGTWRTSAQKSFQTSETETKELLGGTEEQSISLTRGHWFAPSLQATKSMIVYFLASLIFDCLRRPWLESCLIIWLLVIILDCANCVLSISVSTTPILTIWVGIISSDDVTDASAVNSQLMSSASQGFQQDLGGGFRPQSSATKHQEVCWSLFWVHTATRTASKPGFIF